MSRSRNLDRVTWYQWFESGFLQRRVSNELWQLGWGYILRQIVSCFTADDGLAHGSRPCELGSGSDIAS